jgi:hypothetical protein
MDKVNLGTIYFFPFRWALLIITESYLGHRGLTVTPPVWLPPSPPVLTTAKWSIVASEVISPTPPSCCVVDKFIPNCCWLISAKKTGREWQAYQNIWGVGDNTSLVIIVRLAVRFYSHCHSPEKWPITSPQNKTRHLPEINKTPARISGLEISMCYPIDSNTCITGRDQVSVLAWCYTSVEILGISWLPVNTMPPMLELREKHHQRSSYTVIRGILASVLFSRMHCQTRT